MGADLDRAVSAVVRNCLGVQAGEQVVVVCDSETRGLGEALRAESAGVGAEAVLALMDPREVDGNEPPAAVAAAMAAADVVLAPTFKSISHTEARRQANAAGARIATLPGVTEDMLARVMGADMAELERRGAAVAEALSAASEAAIVDANGSDLRLDLSGREGITDDGKLRSAGDFGNLPAGEGFISPCGASGTLAIDGSIGGVGLAAEVMLITVEDDHAVSATGPQGESFMSLLQAPGEAGTTIAELGIGTNESATLTGNILEDEKILGTCHVAFGASAGIGGTVSVPVHLDCIVMRPEVLLDGEPIVHDGRLLV